MQNNLEGINQTKLDTGMFKGHFRKGGKSLKVHKADQVPDEFVKTRITEKVDATALKKAIERRRSNTKFRSCGNRNGRIMH